MNKKFLRCISFVLSVGTLLGCAACGDNGGSGGGGGTGGGGGDDSAIEIKIYAGGSSEYEWIKGSKEEEVYNYIEDVYYDEMGVRLDFKTEFPGQGMKDNIINGITEGKIDVVISHVGGGDGLDDWFLGKPSVLYRDLSADLEIDITNVADNMLWDDGAGLQINALDRTTKLNGEVIGIPSVITPYKFGILVRKDWMEACGYTDDPNNTDLTLVDNYVEFENMAVAMRERYNLNYAVSGAIYEVEKTGLLGAYGLDAGYYSMTKMQDGNGNNIIDYGGQINPAYAQVLEVESRWIDKKVLATSPDAIKVVQCETEFCAESTGIFLQNGTIEHLIEVARKCKTQNPEAEFTVLSGLTKDADSTAKGSMRNSVGTFMASITSNTPDYKELLQFINWMYSSEETYNMCRYGEEGVHWIDNGDGTYSYPANSGFGYHNKPYSGILTLVENQVISNLQYADYTADEKAWIETVRNRENYIVNDTVDYLLYLSDKTLMNTHFAQRKAMSTFTQNVWDDAFAHVYKETVEGEEVVQTDKSRPSELFTVAQYGWYQENIVNSYRTNANAYSRALYDLYAALKAKNA